MHEEQRASGIEIKLFVHYIFTLFFFNCFPTLFPFQSHFHPPMDGLTCSFAFLFISSLWEDPFILKTWILSFLLPTLPWMHPACSCLRPSALLSSLWNSCSLIEHRFSPSPNSRIFPENSSLTALPHFSFFLKFYNSFISWDFMYVCMYVCTDYLASLEYNSHEGRDYIRWLMLSNKPLENLLAKNSSHSLSSEFYTLAIWAGPNCVVL